MTMPALQRRMWWLSYACVGLLFLIWIEDSCRLNVQENLFKEIEYLKIQNKIQNSINHIDTITIEYLLEPENERNTFNTSSSFDLNYCLENRVLRGHRISDYVQQISGLEEQ